MKRSGLAAAALFLLALASSPATRAEQEGPVLLLVPLIAPAGDQTWVVQTLDMVLEKKLSSLAAVRLAGGEKRTEALRALKSLERIGPDELAAAARSGQSDFVIIGQVRFDEDLLTLDLGAFSALEKEQTSSFHKQAPLTEAFSLMAGAARFAASATGTELSEEEAVKLEENPTSSLEAYHAFAAGEAETDPSRRISLLEKAVEIDQSYYDANLRLGLDLYRLGRAGEALPYMERAADLRSDVPEAHNNLAVLYARLGRQNDALVEFEAALKLQPDYQEAWLNYGRLLEEIGRYDQAEGVYTDLLEKDPANVKARSSMALLYERTGRTELAIQEFRVLSREAPELAEDYFLQTGKEARKAKHYQKAERFFQRAVDINPQFAEGYAALGTNSYLEGNYEKSMEFFRQALALEPQRGEYHYYLGLAHEKGGRQSDALESFLRSAELGGPLESRVSLARIWLAEGELLRAIDELNLVLDEDPSQGEAKDLLSRAMAKAKADREKGTQRAEFATLRLSRLEAIIEDLTRTNRGLESRVYSLQNERKGLERELEQLLAEREEREVAYGKRMEEAIRSIEQLSGGDELEQLRREYLIQVRELELQLAEARQTIEEAERLRLPEDEDVARELIRARERAVSLAGEVESLQGELAAERESVKELSREVEDLKEREAERLSYLSRLEEKRDELQLEKDREGRELSRLQERNRNLTEKVAGLERELEETVRSLNGLRSEAVGLRGKSTESGRETSGLRELVQKLRASKSSLENELGESREGYGELVVKSNRLETELEETRSELETSRAATEELNSRLAAVELDSYRRIEEALSKARVDVSARDEELARHREREKEAAVGIEQLRQTVGSQKERLEALEVALGEARVEVEAREEELARHREREKEAAVGKERLLQTVGSQRERLEALEEALGGARGEVEARKEELARYRQFDKRLAAGEEALAVLEKLRGELVLQAMELGTIHMQNRSLEKASRYFLRVVEVDPRNSRAYYSLGEIYLHLGRFDLSKQMYQKAKESY